MDHTYVTIKAGYKKEKNAPGREILASLAAQADPIAPAVPAQFADDINRRVDAQQAKNDNRNAVYEPIASDRQIEMDVLYRDQRAIAGSGASSSNRAAVRKADVPVPIRAYPAPPLPVSGDRATNREGLWTPVLRADAPLEPAVGVRGGSDTTSAHTIAASLWVMSPTEEFAQEAIDDDEGIAIDNDEEWEPTAQGGDSKTGSAPPSKSPNVAKAPPPKSPSANSPPAKSPTQKVIPVKEYPVPKFDPVKASLPRRDVRMDT